MSNTGALIVATPLDGDPIHSYITETDPHITMLWFGDAAAVPADVASEIRLALADVVNEFQPFQATVAGRALLGPDSASVLLLESAELVEIRSILALNDAVQQAWELAERQFPWWVCHLTTAYDGTLPVDPPESVSIGNLALWMGEERENFPLADIESTLASVMVPPVTCLDDLAPAVRYADQNPSARWYAERRAIALDATDMIPTTWAVPV